LNDVGATRPKPCIEPQLLTVDVSSMILDDVNARSIPGVPDPDGEVPAAGHEQIRYLRIPEQSADWAGVSMEDSYCSTLLCVIPHPYGATAQN